MDKESEIIIIKNFTIGSTTFFLTITYLGLEWIRPRDHNSWALFVKLYQIPFFIISFIVSVVFYAIIQHLPIIFSYRLRSVIFIH